MADSPGWGDLGNLLLDAGRAKYVDIERQSDDRNIPDSVDMRAASGQVPSAGMSKTMMIGGGVGVVLLLVVMMSMRR